MTEDDLTGKQLDEYQLEALLGEGGMARVYLGRDVYLKRHVAIKVISPTLREDDDYLKRFEREARAIASLEHPHIVRLYRYGELNGLLYMAMQFIEGSDLCRILRGYRQSGEYIEYPEAARLIREIGHALDYVHTRGIIHRDVKSSNIMLDRAGQSYLADFGLVLLNEVGTRGEIFGSPHYLAPEQAISSAKAVPQSDLYSLGVIAYEMFTGQLPFDAKDPLEIAMQHMSKEPPRPRELRPELPARLEAVLLKALAKQPEARYQSGAALAAAIDAALATPPAPGIPEPPPTSKTIPERVALNMADRPLPPIPAAVTPLPAASVPAPASTEAPSTGTRPGFLVAEEEAQAGARFNAAHAQPARSPGSAARPAAVEARPAPSPDTRRSWVLLTIVALAGACVLAACLGVYALGRASLNGLQAAAPQVTGFPPLLTDSTPTLEAGSRPFPSSTPRGAVANPGEPTPTALSGQPRAVTLAISRCSDGHCLGILNLSQVDLPLSGLVIQGKTFSFTGSDWDIDRLGPGECLVLTGEAGKWTPQEAACQDASATLVSKAEFWKEEIDLSYAGEAMGSCDKKSRTCEFEIPIE